MALIDSTKFGRNSLLAIFAADEPEEIITDDDISAELVAEYRAAGVAVVVAAPNQIPVKP